MKKLTEEALENAAGGKDLKDIATPDKIDISPYLHGYDPDPFRPSPPLTKPEDPECNLHRNSDTK